MRVMSAGAPGALPFLGRQDELAELRAGLDDAKSGHGRLFLVAGEAGMGKSRLIDALVQLIDPTEVRAYWGRCWDGGGGPTYWPWVQVIRAAVADIPKEALARELGPWGDDIAVLAPELRAAVPGLASASPSVSPDARVRLFDAVSGFLCATAAKGGLLLALDDLHAADDVSLRLLEHLAAERLSDSHLLVVGTYRAATTRSSQHLDRRLATIARHGRPIVLGGLEADAVRTLLSMAIGQEPAAPVVDRVHEVSDGNPLFVQKLAQMLRVDGGDLGPLGAVSLPEEVDAVVRHGLARLDDPTRQLLTLAAVVGREFDLPMLEDVTGDPQESILDILTTAGDLGVVEEVGLGRWAFSHGLIREALYDDLEPFHRAELHRRAGEAVERRGGSTAEVTELAHHFFEAGRDGDPAKGVRYCSMAGDAAMASYAFQEATAQFRRALDALALAPSPEGDQRYEVLVALGEAERRAGHFPEARQSYRRAVKEARAVGSPELLGRAAIGYAGLPESTVDETRSSIVREADAALSEEDSGLRARLLRASSSMLGHDEARQRSSCALRMARRVDDPATLREVLLQWHLFNQGADLLEARRAVAEELIGLSIEANDKERLVIARQWRAWDLLEAGDIDGVRAELQVAKSEAEQLRLPFLIWGVTFMEATVALLEARLEDAERLAREAVAAGERSEYADVEGVRFWQLYSIRREQARFEEMVDLARRAAENPAAMSPGVARLSIALALAELGRVKEAREELDAAVDDLLGGVPGWLTMLADTCWIIGEPAWAEEIHDRLVPLRGRHMVIGAAIATYGSCDRYLGQMCTLLGRYDEASSHFQAAHALHRRLGARSWVARGQADHAAMLLRRDEPGDLVLAMDLIHEARDQLRALGMEVPARRVEQLTRSLGGEQPERAPRRASFRLEGEQWAVEYDGLQIRLTDSRGVRYLARLLARPSQEIHALDLVDPEPGSDRKVSSDIERARQSTTRAIKTAVDRIEEAHPKLGEHLRTTVRTGIYSAYTPDPRAPIRWTV